MQYRFLGRSGNLPPMGLPVLILRLSPRFHIRTGIRCARLLPVLALAMRSHCRVVLDQQASRRSLVTPQDERGLSLRHLAAAQGVLDA
jgi:hypothetical protein